jgi:hypothetical protein
MSFQVIEGGGQGGPAFTVPLYGPEIIQLAHNPEHALFVPYQQNRADILTGDILNVAYADTLAMVSPESTVPDDEDRLEFIADTHSYTARLISESQDGASFRIIQSIFSRRLVDWCKLLGVKPTPPGKRPATTAYPIARDARNRHITNAANRVLLTARLMPPLYVPVEHEPSLARREQFVPWILRGISVTNAQVIPLRSISE